MITENSFASNDGIGYARYYLWNSLPINGRLRCTKPPLLLSFVGGLVGLTSAWILGQIVNIFMSTYAANRGINGGIALFSVSFFLAGLSLVFVLFLGYLVVFFPARRAAHINPIDALRHE